MRHAPDVRAAVVCMDMAAAGRLISVRLMRQYVALRPAWTGVPLVREALALASDDSLSPQETRMRLIWILDAGLSPPLCNRPVFSLEGEPLGYPDLFDPVAGALGEYDGADHKGRERHRRDVAREARYRDHGLEYFTVVGGDIRDRDLVVKRMVSTRLERGSTRPTVDGGRSSRRPGGRSSTRSTLTSSGRARRRCWCAAEAAVRRGPAPRRDSPQRTDPEIAPGRVRMLGTTRKSGQPSTPRADRLVHASGCAGRTRRGGSRSSGRCR